MEISCQNLIEKIKSYNEKADTELVKKAFDFAARIHQNHFRLSGDPYLTHPLKVAETLAELEQDPTIIAAGLLHDTMEDGGISADQIAADFNPVIAQLVSGVTKLGRISFESKEEKQAENFRKMFLAMGEDIRVIIIKLADRLHNMKTIQYLPAKRQKDIAAETRDIFAPLAHRLGMWQLKWQLEDLVFRILEPRKFEQVKNQVAQSRNLREKYVAEFIQKLQELLQKVKIQAQIYGRAKHFYSIYRKLVIKNIEFDDLYDLFAVRVLVDSVKDCYAVLGIVHSSWKPIPGRFRDHIAVPKSNGYQSLHTTVIGPGGKPVEIQIRTKEMNQIAEYGIASHWRYKEGGIRKTFDNKLAWLRQMLELQSDLKDAKDFLENLKTDLFVDEIFTFTPKGDVVVLSTAATALDFAYRVHTEVGHKCIGAKVNGRIAPLSQKLENGNIVEIITGKISNPSLDWLNFVQTSTARTKIKHWFKKQKNEENIFRGKRALEEEIKKTSLSPEKILDPANLALALGNFNFKKIEDLYIAIGHGEISALAAFKKLYAKLSKEKILTADETEIKPLTFAPPAKRRTKGGIKVCGQDGVLTKLSKCCSPIPGDEIVGFVTKGAGVSIHKRDCKNVLNGKIAPEKITPVEWSRDQNLIYPVEIEVTAFDRVGILRDIVTKIGETRTNISSANMQTKRGSSAILKIILDVADLEHLHNILKAIRSVSDVYDVKRG